METCDARCPSTPPPQQQQPRLPILRTPDGGAACVALLVHFSGAGGTVLWEGMRRATGSTGSGGGSGGMSFPRTPGGMWGCQGLATQAAWTEAMDPSGRRCGCAELLQERARSGFVAWSMENPVGVPYGPEPHGCECVAYWTAVRPPVERILSRMYKKTVVGVMASPAAVRHALERTTRLNASGRLRGMQEFSGTAAVDNWMVRSLGGADVYRRGLGALDEAHYATAKARLARMHAIPMANLSSAATAALLGLPRGARLGVATSGHGHAGVPAEALADDFVELLERHNRLDARLYRYAQRLYESRVRARAL